MVYNQVMQRILVAIAGIILYISIAVTPIGTFIDKWAIWIVGASLALLLFSKKIAKNTGINDDIPIVIGGTTLFLSGKNFLIPHITGNIAWIAIVIAIAIMVYKRQLTELILK